MRRGRLGLERGSGAGVHVGGKMAGSKGAQSGFQTTKALGLQTAVAAHTIQ